MLTEDGCRLWAVDGLAEALPVVTRVVLDTGHVPWLEAPAEFAAVLRSNMPVRATPR